jgi:Hint domain
MRGNQAAAAKTYSYKTAVGASDQDGSVSATATITVSGNTMTVTLTDLTPNATSEGQAIGSIQVNFASGPGTVVSMASTGQLVAIQNGQWVNQTGSVSHWGNAVVGNSLYIATAGTGSDPAKPIQLIVDTKAGASNANSSFLQHSPSIADTATFTITFSGPPPTVTGVNFGFGTSPQDCGYTQPGQVVCYLAGTRIATSAQETVPVETLKIGDRVLTHDGRQVPVLWVGRLTVSRNFADVERTLPIRIKAGALGDNLPERDLLVSRCHALLVDGVLVQAGALVNGLTVTVETEMPETYVYYHVETEDHDLILAEGVASETFIDNADRMNFDNWAEHQALFPQGRAVEEIDLPRVTAARQTPAGIKARLLTHAGELMGEVAQAA